MNSKPDWKSAPEEASHWGDSAHSVGGKWIEGFYKETDPGEWSVWFDSRWISGCEENTDWNERFESLTPRPTAPTWNGEGLPPVGTLCEIAASTDRLKVSYTEGAKVKIYANFTDDRGVELAAFVDEIGNVGGVAIAKCFRPIRTPEQIAAEERERAVMEIYERANKQGGSVLSMLMEAYDAGCLKVNS